MKTNSGGKIWNLILFLILLEIFYFFSTYVDIGGFGVGYQYLGCIAVALLGGIFFLLFPDVTEFLGRARISLLLMSPFFCCMLASLGIWIFSFTGIRQMISGFFEPGYMLICLTAVGCLSYVLKEKLIPYLFWAMNLAFSIMIVQQMRLAGPGEFFRQMYVLVTSNAIETLPIMKQLELPRFSYAYVFFFIYFLYKRKEEGNVKFAFRMLACVFFFLVGYKRSCILALAVSLAFSLLYRMAGTSSRRKILNLGAVILAIFCVACIPVIRNGLFDYVVERLQIDTNNRQEIYEYYKQFYRFAPDYWGQGLGWAMDHMRTSEEIGDAMGRLGIHYEYVRGYIELGFCGYLLWILVSFPWLMRKLSSCRNVDSNAAIMAVFIAMAVLYTTENIWAYYSPVMVMGAIVLRSWQMERGADHDV